MPFFLFTAAPVAYGSSQARGRIGAAAASPIAQPQQSQIWVASVTYATACSNAGCLTHWVRPGIESTSSWIIVRFLTCWATMGAPSTFNHSWCCIFFFWSVKLELYQIYWHFSNNQTLFFHCLVSYCLFFFFIDFHFYLHNFPFLLCIWYSHLIIISLPLHSVFGFLLISLF